jgi:uncharacterized protein HemX
MAENGNGYPFSQAQQHQQRASQPPPQDDSYVGFRLTKENLIFGIMLMGIASGAGLGYEDLKRNDDVLYAETTTGKEDRLALRTKVETLSTSVDHLEINMMQIKEIREALDNASKDRQGQLAEIQKSLGTVSGSLDDVSRNFREVAGVLQKVVLCLQGPQGPCKNFSLPFPYVGDQPPR